MGEVFLFFFCVAYAEPSPYRGQVTFNGFPVPGAAVTATQGDTRYVTVTDLQGMFVFADLSDGACSIDIELTGFSPVRREVTISPNSSAENWELKLLPLDQIQTEKPSEQPVEPTIAPSPALTSSSPSKTSTNSNQPATTQTAPPPAPDEDVSQQATNGLLINGSTNNGAASPFAQAAAFGNNRVGAKGLYNGGIGMILDNSALDAKPFSLTGQNTPKASYNDLTGVLTLGGPLRIPHLLHNGPNFFVGYQWTRNSNASTQSALVPQLSQRNGVFSSAVLDPLTNLPFAGNVIPQNRISPQALSLLSFYPLPNFDGGARYNYQLPITSTTHQDALQSRLAKTLNNRNQVYGRFAFQSTRETTPNLFGFLDTTDILGINTTANLSHRFGQRSFLNLGAQFSRLSTRVTPFFENRENVSANAGIFGNDQDPRNWGPPGLTFASGIAGLSDVQSSFNRNRTDGVSASLLWVRGLHNITWGSDFRRQEFNYLGQQDPRGSFTFTGAATGSDFADFLLGIPDTSSIAFGNADKYFRESVYDAYVSDDWRMRPELTLNFGLRWEYAAPITELYGRLVNLDILPGFTAVAPVVATSPVGLLTNQHYPSSLLRPDKTGIEPRIGIAWRPISGSSLVLRAGYGVYYNTSVYQTIATQLAQQPPLSKTLSVQNSPADPLTLANGFNASPSITPNTFAVDPNFRVGYAQNWQVALQRDLPGSLQMLAAYLGIKGTHGVQEFLPNTFPAGTANPCPACPAGYTYVTSNGNSSREAAQFQLRRRLHNGFTGMLQYTFSKSIDDDASLGGQGPTISNQIPNASTQNPSGSGSGAQSSGAPSGATALAGQVAQNWLDLRAERSLSTFDQRHLLSFQLQYTSGMGVGGGTLLSGWRAALLKEWTFLTQVTAGTGLPLNPLYLAAVPGTGVTGTIRPEYTGASLYAAPSGFFLNSAAYAAPLSGEWGNAGRNSITGPVQFSLNASMGRTFRLNDRLNLDLRIDSTNALNHVTYTAWNTTINNAQFGLPTAANAMRSLQTTLRLRF